MRRKNKKGFTIVELVIVIAVIGVLSAILIPTFINLTNKANEASDQSLVHNLNTVLAMKEDQNVANPTEMLEFLASEGYDGETLIKKQRSGKQILYKLAENRFVFEADETNPQGPNYWVLSSTYPTGEGFNAKKYSYYLNEDFAATDSLIVNSGLDVGKNDDVTGISYSNSDNQEVVIRTNGGTLNIGTSEADAAGKIVHYGTLDEAIVYTTSNSFHTHGKIASMDLKTGKAVAEDKGYVALVKAAAGTEIEEKDTGIFYIPSGTAVANIDSDVAADLGYKSNGAEVATFVIDTTTAKGQERAEAVASTAYEISDKNELIAFRNAWNAGKLNANMTFVLTKDVDMLGYAWLTPIGTEAIKFIGKFDGQGHKISNLSNNGLPSTEILVNNTTGNQGSIFGLFGFVGGETEIKSFDISVHAYSVEKANGWGAVVAVAKDYDGSLTIKNINVSGLLSGKDKAGGIAGDVSGSLNHSFILEFADCNNYADVTGDRAAGIACCVQNSTNVVFNNCHNFGNITSTKTNYGTVAGITAMNSTNTTFTDCSNERNTEKNTGQLDGFIAYDLATYVFTTFNTNGTYKAVTTTLSPSGMLREFGRFAGDAITEYDWHWLETHANSGEDYTGLFAGITYGLDTEYEIVTDEVYVDSNHPENNHHYSRKFETLNDAVSHKLSGDAVVTISTNQTLNYTLQDGFGGTNLWNNDVTAVRPTIDMNGHTITANVPLVHSVVNGFTFTNGTINYTGEGTHGLGGMTGGTRLTLENVTLNGGTISIGEGSEGTTISRFIFDGNSIVNCYFDLGGTSTTSVKINDVTYSQAGGRYVIITNNVISQNDSLPE